ncbi:MAG: ribonuclease P protein component [Bacillota bacterium]|jgi:ribonuclease P protein component
MLDKINRLQKNKDFRRIYQKGKSRSFDGFVLYYYKSHKKNGLQIGFSVSKKNGKAVQRNFIKRRFREACRHLIEQFVPGYDYIFIIRRSAFDMSFAQLKAEIVRAINIIHID